MLKGPLQFCWFSGTGNTLLVVREMISIFKNSGISANATTVNAALNYAR